MPIHLPGRHDSPHQTGAPGYMPHDRPLIGTLRRLARGWTGTHAALADIADGLEPLSGAGEFIRRPEHAQQPIEFVLNALALRLRELDYEHWRALGEAAAEGGVVLFPPLPPHLLDSFVDAGGVMVARVDHHHLPPHLRYGRGLRVCEDPVQIVSAVKAAHVVVFDAHWADGLKMRRVLTLYLDDGRLNAAARVFVHLRPMGEPDDVASPPGLADRIQPV